MPEYRVTAHRRVFKFPRLEKRRLENRLKESVLELENYPISLRRLG